MAMKKRIDANRLNLKDEVVSINRVTKVVKGGKNMSFAALGIIGDPGEGIVGYGSGKRFARGLKPPRRICTRST